MYFFQYLFTSFPQNEMVTRSDTRYQICKDYETRNFSDIPDPLILSYFPDSISIILQGETALGSASVGWKMLSYEKNSDACDKTTTLW